METYTAEMIWAASWAAFKHNDYQYIRDGYVTDGTKDINKNLLALFLRSKDRLSEDDLEMGRKMREFYSRLTFTALERELNSFEKTVADFVIKEEFTFRDFAIMASLAGKFYRDAERTKKMQAVAALVDGKHVGEVGGNVRLAHVRVLNSMMSHKYLKYFNMGECEGNLVSWWTDATPASNDLTMTARVKDHTSWNSDGTTVLLTKLNYVKATPLHLNQ